MSAIEIKGNFINFLANIEDGDLLRRMLEACVDLARREDALDDLPPEILAELEEAVRLSYDERNLIPHEVVQKEREQWLKELDGNFSAGEKPSDFAGIWKNKKKSDAKKLRKQAWQR